jgi:hypothetical protein
LQNVLSAAQRLDKAVWFGKAVHGVLVQQPDAILAVAAIGMWPNAFDVFFLWR